MEKSKINLNSIDNAPSLDIAPWVLSAPTVRFDLTKLKKDTTNPEIYKEFYFQLITEYPSWERWNEKGKQDSTSYRLDLTEDKKAGQREQARLRLQTHRERKKRKTE